MNLRETVQLKVWLRARVSLAEIEEVARLCTFDSERFSDDAVRAFRLHVRWSASHASDDA